MATPTVPPLSAGECQVWWASRAAAALSLLDLLDEHERGRWSRFMREEDKALYLVSHAVRRLVLGAHARIPAREIRFSTLCRHCGKSHGKPLLEENDAGLEFSLSHSGHQTVFAVARGVALGIDVEQVKPERDRVSLIPAVLSELERHAIEALPPDRQGRAFLRYWTRKEAVLKATGHGLAIPLQRVSVSAHDAAPALLCWTAEPPLAGPVELLDLAGAPDHPAALCLLGERLDVVERDAGPLLAAF
jgi:4'-phosphopantetheinyl transferase